jgi:hypothetical protein
VGFVVTLPGRVASAIKRILGGSGLQTLSAASGTLARTSDSTPVTNATVEPADTARAGEKADVSASAMSTKLVTETQQISTDTGTSTKDATGTAEAKVTSTRAMAAKAAERPSGASVPKLTKTTVRSATPRPMVRNSLELGGRLRDLARSGHGGRLTSQTAADGDGAGTAESSSGAKSSAGSFSAGSNSPGGDADGS